MCNCTYVRLDRYVRGTSKSKIGGISSSSSGSVAAEGCEQRDNVHTVTWCSHLINRGLLYPAMLISPDVPTPSAATDCRVKFKGRKVYCHQEKKKILLNVAFKVDHIAVCKKQSDLSFY